MYKKPYLSCHDHVAELRALPAPPETIRLKKPLTLGLPPMQSRIREGEKTVRYFYEFSLHPGYEEIDLVFLQNEFNRSVRRNPDYLPGHITQISRHLSLLEKFIKYPTILHVETSPCCKSN